MPLPRFPHGIFRNQRILRAAGSSVNSQIAAKIAFPADKNGEIPASGAPFKFVLPVGIFLAYFFGECYFIRIMLAIATSTLLAATLFFVVVGVLLIGGGIAYLIMDSKKERKTAARKDRQQAMQSNTHFAPLPGTQATPPAGQANPPSK